MNVCFYSRSVCESNMCYIRTCPPPRKHTIFTFERTELPRAASEVGCEQNNTFPFHLINASLTDAARIRVRLVSFFFCLCSLDSLKKHTLPTTHTRSATRLRQHVYRLPLPPSRYTKNSNFIVGIRRLRSALSSRREIPGGNAAGDELFTLEPSPNAEAGFFIVLISLHQLARRWLGSSVDPQVHLSFEDTLKYTQAASNRQRDITFTQYST